MTERIIKLFAALLLALILLGTTDSPPLQNTNRVTAVADEMNTVQKYAGPASQKSIISLANPRTAVLLLNSQSNRMSDRTIIAIGKDQSSIMAIKGSSLNISESTITKTGDAGTISASRMGGLNACIVSETASHIGLSDCTVITGGRGASAIYAVGEKSRITADQVIINTLRSYSAALNAAYGGEIEATDVNIRTNSDHSPAMAVQQGDGNIHYSGGVILTIGRDSPGLYATGNLTVEGAKITAKSSEAVIGIEQADITLTDTVLLSGAKHGIAIYENNSVKDHKPCKIKMNGGSLSVFAGTGIYSEGAKSEFTLSNYRMTIRKGKVLELRNSHKQDGGDGSAAMMIVERSILEGDITGDVHCTATVSLKSRTQLKGTINKVNSMDNATLNLDRSSVWYVTGTSYVTCLEDEDSSLLNIKDNGNIIYYDSSKTTNSWLHGKTISLQGGGKLQPMESR